MSGCVGACIVYKLTGSMFFSLFVKLLQSILNKMNVFFVILKLSIEDVAQIRRLVVSLVQRQAVQLLSPTAR